MRPVMLLAVLVTTGAALAQDEGRTIPIGQRHIDTLPKSGYPRPVEGEYPGWADRPTGEWGIAVHLKPGFRVGTACLERLVVVEAHGPAMHPGPAKLELVDASGDVIWSRRVWWLRGNQQMRAYWWPVTAAEPCLAQIVTDRKVQVRCEVAPSAGAPAAAFEVTADPEPVAVDEGLGLAPWSLTLLREGGTLWVGAAVPSGQAPPVTVRARLIAADGRELRSALRELPPAEGPCALRFAIPCAGLSAGEYTLALSAAADGCTRAAHAQQVRICPERAAPRFGASYTMLSHPAPVYVGVDQTARWEDLWAGSDLRDVVVSFPDRPQRFVFWRGTSYVPCWALPNAWLTYEWLEAEPDHYGAVDCVEPIMDKQCRYSRARIVESSPARVVVHWRYALTDLECKIIKDEWADEYFHLYPDAVGTRWLVAWIQGYAWHENQEFIVLNRPGGRPSQALEPQAVTFLNTAGEKVRPHWPCPRFTVPGGWPDLIARVNFRGQPDPFQAIGGGNTSIKVWADPYVDKPDLFNSYWHWPVSRGIRTEWLTDPSYFERPTHSNLVNIVNDPDLREETWRSWTWLIGLAPGDARLREIVDAWLRPPEVAVEGLRDARYDRDQRAWVMRANGARDARITVSASEATPVVNPAFVIEGWRGEAQAQVVGSDMDVTLGHERDGRDLVAWVRGRLDRPFTVKMDRR